MVKGQETPSKVRKEAGGWLGAKVQAGVGHKATPVERTSRQESTQAPPRFPGAGDGAPAVPTSAQGGHHPLWAPAQRGLEESLLRGKAGGVEGARDHQPRPGPPHTEPPAPLCHTLLGKLAVKRDSDAGKK